MRKWILILFIFFSFTANLHSQWVNIGPSGLTIHSMVSSGPNILAATGILYFSSNNGQNWVQSSLPSNSVWCLSVNQSTIFAGTLFDGIFTSTNNGLNWSLLINWSQELVISMSINNSYVFAGIGPGNYEGVMVSSNNGINWAITPVQFARVYSLASVGSKVFAGTYFNGILYSTNYGQNWSQTIPWWTFSLLINGSNIYAGTSANGVYSSSLQTINWTQTSLDSVTVYSLTAYNSIIFAGTMSFGVYMTTDGGLTWVQHNEGMGNLIIASFLISSGYIFAGTESYGVYRRPLGELVKVEPQTSHVPDHYRLYQNFPNPFNPSTKIKFDVPEVRGEKLEVRLTVYDILGREVATLVNDELAPGTYEVEWNGSNYSSGVYFYKIIVDASAGAKDATSPLSITKKMVLVK